ncbi:glycosyltransferase family 2 protein [Micromonospora siamensis]|uniref:Glycosyltransferase, GT2 family n=1 Tax=Micromonospora siamensis TaxID=299152 RepID=A0A1C5IL23_9ACTN|nr:glycosyltransferase [Micromonospora siamensis]SCG58833.1 Glycosyltransferase, GT2 family [Micromonospora siamensis]
MTTDVTVVVATRNRRHQLLETLTRHAAPVIVVDNGSTDGTPAAVRAEFPEIRVIELGRNAGAGAARNAGVDATDTPFVAFADDDSYWAPGALDRAADLLRAHPGTALLAARVLVGPDRRLDPICPAMAAAPLGTAPGAPGPTVLGFLGCAVVLRREAYRRVGGFTERLGTYGEEALLAMDLAAAGWNLAYAPELVAHHLPQPDGRDPGARARVEARNRLLTAALRRPGRVVLGEMVRAWRAPRQRAALVDAARELGWALRHRRPLPSGVERNLATLERGGDGRPDHMTDTPSTPGRTAVGAGRIDG